MVPNAIVLLYTCRNPATSLGVEASTHAYFLFLFLLESLWSEIWSNVVPGISTSGTRFSATSNSQSETRIPSTFGRLYVRGLSRGKWKPVGGYVHGATLGDKGVYITETSGTNRGTWRSKIKTLMAMIVVQNGYPLCRNGGKFTPYLHKRQQRLVATNPPSFWSFLYSRLRSTITFECLPRRAQQNLG